MSETFHHPEQWSHLAEMANELLGGFALYANDDFFAEKENLLKRNEAVFIDGKYTEKGKWMDGWESQRRRTPGHDFCILRLGVPGAIHGVVVDTTHFRGNAPSEIALEGVEMPGATVDQLLASEAWFPLISRSKVNPNSKNPFDVAERKRVTHLKLRIYPDGGVARLRVFGEVIPEPSTFWNPGSIDLVALENGGTVVRESNKFFGPSSNLTLPGRGVNMGDGWETARRRTPGSDWCVLKLVRPGVIDRIELDTHFFKGNAPQAVKVEAVDARGWSAEQLESLRSGPFGAGDAGWDLLLAKTPTEQHKRHQFTPDRAMVVTHVRVHMYPHGGINRLRLFGTSVDTAEDTQKISSLNSIDSAQATELLKSFCGAPGYAAGLLAARPFADVRALFAASDRVFWSLSESELLAAYAAHPRIGQKKAAETATAKSANWSSGEQSGTAGAAEDVMSRLAAGNDAYFEKFGFIFICFATGRTAAQMLEILEERLQNDRATEIRNAAYEQSRITRLRLGKWLLNR